MQHSFAQQKIDAIELIGLKSTKKTYVTRFIQQQPGMFASDSLMQIDVQQLKNLEMVTDASGSIVERNDSTIVQFNIEEAITFFPIINFGGIKENIWFQVGAKEQNLGGKGIQLLGHYLNNNQLHNGQIHLRVPFINGTKWGISANLQRWSSPEPLYFDSIRVNYIYSSSIAGAGIIRAFGFQHSLELSGGYFIENYERSTDNRIADMAVGPENARIPKTIGKLEHRIGKMNYHLFYLNGWNVEQHAQIINDLTLQNEDLFLIYWANFHRLKTIGNQQKCNVALRGRIGISSNGNTPFAPFVIDSQMNIRGVGNRIDRGTATVVLNLELRQTLLENTNWAAQGVLFSDAGTWRQPAGDFSDLYQKENFVHFVGGGFRGIYKKAFNAILRVDYGFDVYNGANHGLVIGLGQYF